MKIYHVDAFTDKMFKGNPAVVCILPGPGYERWMQDMAMEMNVSETAFLYKSGDGFNLRWFTPWVEVDLCGHATLASAHALWESGSIKPGEEAVFYTKSGRLTAKKEGEYIILNFPVEEERPAETPKMLAKSLNVPILYTGRNRMDYLVEVSDENTVKNLDPDFAVMSKVDTRGVIVTSRATNPAYDFVSRFFGPLIGDPEDPVTGSAHCCLGPYWMKRLGKSEMKAYQASKRGGYLSVKVCGDRVQIGGQAVTVFSTEM